MHNSKKIGALWNEKHPEANNIGETRSFTRHEEFMPPGMSFTRRKYRQEEDIKKLPNVVFCANPGGECTTTTTSRRFPTSCFAVTQKTAFGKFFMSNTSVHICFMTQACCYCCAGVCAAVRTTINTDGTFVKAAVT